MNISYIFFVKVDTITSVVNLTILNFIIIKIKGNFINDTFISKFCI